MPRRPASVTQADIARAIRALQATGVQRVRVVFRPEGVSVEADDRPEVPCGLVDPPREEREPWIM